MSERFAWVAPFVTELTTLADPENPNRAALAHLRRGLGGSADFTLARVGWLFRGIEYEDELEAAILIAGLFAWVKGNCRQTDNMNFGQAFGHGLNDDDKKQREKRFTALLDTDLAELPFVLRQAVTLIEGTPIDWKATIIHLVHWEHPDRWVQRDWARGFWSYPKADETPTDEGTESAITTA